MPEENQVSRTSGSRDVDVRSILVELALGKARAALDRLARSTLTMTHGRTASARYADLRLLRDCAVVSCAVLQRSARASVALVAQTAKRLDLVQLQRRPRHRRRCRPVPHRDLVAPPELARDAPGLDVLQPVEVGLLVALGQDAGAAVADGGERRARRASRRRRTTGRSASAR